MKSLMNGTVVLLLLMSYPGFAASCRNDLESSTPTNRFAMTDDLVQDHETKLTWMRCAIGQTWVAGACSGAPKSMDWNEASAAVAVLNHENYAGHDDWRLPLLPELASIVERKCFYPRANEAVFPGMPLSVFWSGMRRRGSDQLVYAMDFGSGETSAQPLSTIGAVRLVRGGPWWQPPKAAAKY